MVECPPEGATLVNDPASDIQLQAARLLDSAGISKEPVSLRDVISALNLELVSRTREPFTSEAALELLDEGRPVTSQGSHDSGRRRFTIAREIGCFVLHPEHCPPGRDDDDDGEVRAEAREADAFAAELLMPEHLVREAVHGRDPDVADLAHRFQVSRKAMEARLQSLGLGDDDGHL